MCKEVIGIWLSSLGKTRFYKWKTGATFKLFAVKLWLHWLSISCTDKMLETSMPTAVILTRGQDNKFLLKDQQPIVLKSHSRRCKKCLHRVLFSFSISVSYKLYSSFFITEIRQVNSWWWCLQGVGLPRSEGTRTRHKNSQNRGHPRRKGQVL